MRSIEEIDFGRLDAEQDENLSDYFLATPRVIGDIERKGKYIVLGRKGSGKTAIFKHLEDNLDEKWGCIPVNLDLEDYPFEVHKQLKDAGLTEASAYSRSWKLLICLSACIKLFPYGLDEDKKKISSAVRSLGVDSENEFSSTLRKWFSQVKRIDFPSIEGWGGGGIEFQTDTLNSSKINVAIDKLMAAWKNISKNRRVSVLIDRMDDGWSGDDKSKSFIAGGVRAARDINSILRKKNYPSSVILFLRTDIWDAIDFNDWNKTSQDQVRIEWDRDKLLDVIDLRIRSSLDIPIDDPISPWSAVFETGIVKSRQPSNDYIVGRTMMKPRDAIAFCLYAEEAREDLQEKISTGDILEGEKKFSEHMLAELRDEIAPLVKNVKSTIQAMRGVRYRTFELAKWYESCKISGIEYSDSHNLLEALVNCSAVGIYSAGGAAGGSRTTYKYSDPYIVVREDLVYQFHPSLLKALDLIEK